MKDQFDPLHRVVLFTASRKPFLEGNLRVFVEQGLKSLPRRFPGLKITETAIHTDRVELVLDLQRLDEDLTRILLSFKTEVKNLAQKDGFKEPTLWQWNHDEVEIPRS
jgi:hypothetical protein